MPHQPSDVIRYCHLEQLKCSLNIEIPYLQETLPPEQRYFLGWSDWICKRGHKSSIDGIFIFILMGVFLRCCYKLCKYTKKSWPLRAVDDILYCGRLNDADQNSRKVKDEEHYHLKRWQWKVVFKPRYIFHLLIYPSTFLIVSKIQLLSCG